MNRGSTAGFVPPLVYIGFRLFVLLEDAQATCLRCFRGNEEGLSPGRKVLLASSPARPRPATPPCVSTRPARGMSGFWNRQVLPHDVGELHADVLDSAVGRSPLQRLHQSFSARSRSRDDHCSLEARPLRPHGQERPVPKGCMAGARGEDPHESPAR